jgi:hypothetical protein
MTHMENIKKQSSYSHLPNFAILSKNKLYLPNLSTSITILGKWSLEWINSDRYLLGFVQQDDHNNIFYQITSCYEFINDNQLQLIPKHEFITYWNRVYKHEPLLTLIKLNISEFYSSNGANINIVKDKQVIEKPCSDKQVVEKPLIEKQVIEKPCSDKQVVEKPLIEKQVIDKPCSDKQVVDKPCSDKQVVDKPYTKSEKPKKLKEKVIDNHEFTVAKTEKPDVYYVYKGTNHISTCLISTLKISRYMQDVFEHKNVGERIPMNLKLHEGTKKYIPLITESN